MYRFKYQQYIQFNPTSAFRGETELPRGSSVSSATTGGKTSIPRGTGFREASAAPWDLQS